MQFVLQASYRGDEPDDLANYERARKVAMSSPHSNDRQQNTFA